MTATTEYITKLEDENDRLKKQIKRLKAKKLTEYQKYEFCKDIGCHRYSPHSGRCLCVLNDGCLETARTFHDWLKQYDYKIVKEAK